MSRASAWECCRGRSDAGTASELGRPLPHPFLFDSGPLLCARFLGKCLFRLLLPQRSQWKTVDGLGWQTPAGSSFKLVKTPTDFG